MSLKLLSPSGWTILPYEYNTKEVMMMSSILRTGDIFRTNVIQMFRGVI